MSNRYEYDIKIAPIRKKTNKLIVDSAPQLILNIKVPKFPL